MKNECWFLSMCSFPSALCESCVLKVLHISGFLFFICFLKSSNDLFQSYSVFLKSQKEPLERAVILDGKGRDTVTTVQECGRRRVFVMLSVIGLMSPGDREARPLAST